MKKLSSGQGVAAAATLVVAVGAAVWLTQKGEGARLDARRDEIVQAMVAARLKDPESARFKSMVHNAKTKATCGQVNAKNAMGGYVGYTPFIVFADGDLRFAPAENDTSFEARTFGSLVAAHCHQP